MAQAPPTSTNPKVIAIFRDVKFILSKGDISCSNDDIKDLVKRQASQTIKNFDSNSVSNDHLNLFVIGDDNFDLGYINAHQSGQNLFKYVEDTVHDSHHNPVKKLELRVHEAIGVTLDIPDDGKYGILLWPSEPVEDIFIKAFELMGSNSNKSLFNIYNKSCQDSSKHSIKLDKYSDATVAETDIRKYDKLKVKFNHLENNKLDKTIFIRALTGPLWFYDINDDITAADIKWLVRLRQGIPVSQQRLIYNGRQLENNRTVRYYNIPDDATIQLIFTLRGS